jgi:hypothetical protein
MRQQAAFFHSPRMFFCLFIRKVIFSQYNIRRAALSDVLYRLTETNLFHARCSLGPDKQADGKEKPAAGIFFVGEKGKFVFSLFYFVCGAARTQTQSPPSWRVALFVLQLYQFLERAHDVTTPGALSTLCFVRIGCCWLRNCARAYCYREQLNVSRYQLILMPTL